MKWLSMQKLEANKVIWSDAPVTVMHFDSREKAAGMPLRKALAFDEDISIVCVGSPNKASDCVACCGTHPSTAGQVGLIKIYKVEKYKSMFRIYFEAGRRALLNYDMKHSMLTELSDRYSSSIEDFPDKLRAQEQKLHDAKNALFHAKKALTEKECSQLDDILTLSEGLLSCMLRPISHWTISSIWQRTTWTAAKAAAKNQPTAQALPVRCRKPENSMDVS